MIDVTIVVLTYNSEKFILRCLESIVKWTEGVNYEVIVVDNASQDGTLEVVKKFKVSGVKFQIIGNKDNVGFAAGNNVGISKAQGRYVLLLNPDTELIGNSIGKMVSWMDKNPKVGISTCSLLNGDKSLQSTGGFFPTLSRVFLWTTFLDDIPYVGDIFGSYHPHSSFYKGERELDWVTGAFFLVRREVIDKLGMLDEDFFLYVEELEYCMRVKAEGWVIKYVPITGIIHYIGKSGNREGTIMREMAGLKILYKKHFKAFELLILRVLLFWGSLVRALIFGIIDSSRGKIYTRALRSF